MNHVVAIATNYRYLQLAINLCLSIKASDKNVKVGLIYCPAEAENLKPVIQRYFDAKLEVENDLGSPVEFAFKLKTQLYDLSVALFPEAKEFLYLDADVIMCPGRKVSDLFEEHSDKDFTAYCNDVYDYTTKTRTRTDYTFWCDPESTKKKYFHDFIMLYMPQINSSFLYFKKSESVLQYFATVQSIWANSKYEYQKYRGAKPDEFCFNVASALSGFLPHRTTYRPIFFQCFTENQGLEYLLHQYPAFGFAGEFAHANYIVDFYNQLANYYRGLFGLKLKYVVENKDMTPVDTRQIELPPIIRRTLFRAGDLINSDGGCFNPDSKWLNGSLYTIFRKEINMDVYKGKYSGTTSIPHLLIDGKHTEIQRVGFDTNLRLEDFRLFTWDGALMCNHVVVFNDSPKERHIVSCLSSIKDGKLNFWQIPKLPIQTTSTEKNWVFFSEGQALYLIYSLSPYRLFKLEKDIWVQVNVQPKEMLWFTDDMICNSSNPIPIDEYLLVFFHTKQKQVYSHGAALLSAKTKELLHYTKHSFNWKTLGHGLHKDVFYISGAVQVDDNVRIMFGDNDSHAGYMEVDKTALIEAIKNSV